MNSPLKPTMLYVIGAPGSGKSTTLLGALRVLEWQMLDLPEKLHGLLRGQLLVSPEGRIAGAYLGVRRPEFPGTDALSFGVHPDAVAWVQDGLPLPLAGDRTPQLVVGEGARLTTVSFIRELAAYTRLVVVYTRAPEEVTAARRTAQNPAWRRGRATAAANVAAAAREIPGVTFLELDTSHTPPATVAATAAAAVTRRLAYQEIQTP